MRIALDIIAGIIGALYARREIKQACADRRDGRGSVTRATEREGQ